MQEINPYFWYSERKLDFTPNHFVVTKTPVTDQSLVWVYNALSGRFSITNIHENFVTKGGPKREKLAKVKDFGCNNIIFVLLIIPFLVGIYFFFYRMQTGKNKNL